MLFFITRPYCWISELWWILFKHILAEPFVNGFRKIYWNPPDGLPSKSGCVCRFMVNTLQQTSIAMTFKSPINGPFSIAILAYWKVHPYLGPSPSLIGPKPLPVRFTTLSSAILAARALICGWKRLPSWKTAMAGTSKITSNKNSRYSRKLPQRLIPVYKWLPKNHH